MNEKTGKQIVIDACVATSCSSGELFNPEPVSIGIHCRNCLMAITDGAHTAVFSQMLLKEWSDHPSTFSRRWLAEMILAEKVLINVEGSEYDYLLGVAYAGLTTEKAPLTKDFHLVRSALAAGQIIISKEKRFSNIMAKATKVVPEFASLYYGNPEVEEDRCINWIKEGAEKQPDRRIDIWAENFLAKKN